MTEHLEQQIQFQIIFERPLVFANSFNLLGFNTRIFMV